MTDAETVATCGASLPAEDRLIVKTLRVLDRGYRWSDLPRINRYVNQLADHDDEPV